MLRVVVRLVCMHLLWAAKSPLFIAHIVHMAGLPAALLL